MGHAEPPHVTNAQPRAFDPWDVKWIAEVVVKAAFSGGDVKFNISDSAAARQGEHRELWRIVAGDRDVGNVWLLSVDAPVWASSAYGFEVDLTSAVAAAPATRSYRALPVTPAAEVDVALLVPDSVPAAQVEAALRRHGGDILESVALFDEFRGKGVEPGTRSLAWRLTFRHPDRTLRDKEVEARKEKLITALRSELGARPR